MQSVEQVSKPFGFFMGIAVCIAFIYAPLTGAQDRVEPEPWPQVILPQEPDYLEARQLLQKQKWQEATIVLRTILKKNPASTLIAVDLARALAFSDRREEALIILGQSVSREKGLKRTDLIRRMRVMSRLFLTFTTYQTFEEGIALLQSGKYRAAREKFEKALAREPDNIEILVRIGQCLVQEHDYDSAAERLRLAKRLNPFEPETHLWLGRALQHRGEWTGAVEEFEEARAAMPASEWAPLWLSDALNGLSQRKKALEVLEQDLKTNPWHVQTRLALARLQGLPADADAHSITQAREELKLAANALAKYDQASEPRSDLALDIRPKASELKTQIQTLSQQLDSKIENL